MFLSLDWSYPEAPSNNTHPYPAECDEMDRGEWLRALDKLEALHTKTVAAGHDVPAPDSSLRHIEETRASSVTPAISWGRHRPRSPYEKDAGIPSKPRESRLALGNRQGCEGEKVRCPQRHNTFAVSTGTP